MFSNEKSQKLSCRIILPCVPEQKLTTGVCFNESDRLDWKWNGVVNDFTSNQFNPLLQQEGHDVMDYVVCQFVSRTCSDSPVLITITTGTLIPTVVVLYVVWTRMNHFRKGFFSSPLISLFSLTWKSEKRELTQTSRWTLPETVCCCFVLSADT